MKKIRVLLADDSPAFLYAAEALLATVREVEHVDAAASAEAALQMIPSSSPDLVLMDLMMPGMNGIEATRIISALPDAPEVVLVTLHDAAEYRIAAMKNGACDLISKKDFAIAIPDLIARFASGEISPLQCMRIPA